jgi:hypothetical protein
VGGTTDNIRFLDGDHDINVWIVIVLVRDGQEGVRLDACTILLDIRDPVHQNSCLPRSLNFFSRLSVSSGS